MADDRTDRAVDTLAASIVARAVADSIADERTTYADVSDSDWAAVVFAAEKLAPFPDANAVDDAVEHLFRRAQGQEATP